MTVTVTVGGSSTFCGSGSSRDGLMRGFLGAIAVVLLIVIVSGGGVLVVILALTLVGDFDSSIALGSHIIHARTTPFPFWSWGWSWGSHSLARYSLTGDRFPLEVGEAIAVA